MKKLICWLLGHDYWGHRWYVDGCWMYSQYAECHRCGKRVRLDG